MTEGLVWPPTKEDLERLYLVERLSAAKIAKAYALSYPSPKTAESTILHQLKKNGIARRGRTEHIRKVTEEMVDEWVRRYTAGESLKQIAEGMVGPVTVWNHLRERGVQLRDKVEAQIKATMKHVRHPFSGDKIERAYLIGVRYGDFHVVRHGLAVRVRVSTTHPAMAELFESIFSPYGYVHRYPREAPFTGYEWTLECDLDKSFDFLLIKPTINELEAFSPEEFVAFLAGFFDAEGSIYLHKKVFGLGFELQISNTELKLLEFIDESLSGMGYHQRISKMVQNPSRLGYLKEGVTFQLRVFRREEVCRLLALVPFRHRERKSKAQFVRERVCAANHRTGAGERLDWEKLTRGLRAERDCFVRQAQLALLDKPESSFA